MYNLLIRDELEHALHEGFSMYVNGNKYEVTPHFSISGKESILEQFLKILCAQENKGLD